MDPLVLFAVVVAAIAVLGVGLMIRAMLRAPLGFQDREGFHFGAPGRGEPTRVPVRPSRPTTVRPAQAAARRRTRQRSGPPAHAA